MTRDQLKLRGRRRAGAIALGLLLGAGLGACRGGRSNDPAACMRTCEGQCPYTPDSVGDNDEYLECVEACQAKCGG